ncbi:thermonuclease family protein [Roseateles sp. P5_E11]
MKFLSSIALAIPLLLPPGTSAAAEHRHEPWTARCEKTRGVHDGDTFACLPSPGEREPFVVRLATVDAPELGQAYSRAARDGLFNLVGPGTKVECYKVDRFDREVCRATTATGQDVQLVLAQQGLAWHAKRYVREQSPEEAKQLHDAEAAARDGKLGLWVEPDPMAPWDCRRARLKRERCR